MNKYELRYALSEHHLNDTPVPLELIDQLYAVGESPHALWAELTLDAGKHTTLRFLKRRRPYIYG